MGRLAVGEKYKGQKIGELLLLDALKRSYDVSKKSIGSMAVIVDPIDHEAFSFYKKYGFIELPDSGKMFLTMKTIGLLFEYQSLAADALTENLLLITFPFSSTNSSKC